MEEKKKKLDNLKFIVNKLNDEIHGISEENEYLKVFSIFENSF